MAENIDDIDGEFTPDNSRLSVSLYENGSTVTVGATFNDGNDPIQAMCAYISAIQTAIGNKSALTLMEKTQPITPESASPIV